MCKIWPYIFIPPLPEGGGGYTVLPLSVCPSVQNIFRQNRIDRTILKKKFSFFKGRVFLGFFNQSYDFSRKSLSKYLMDTIDFNKHDIDIFCNFALGKLPSKYIINSNHCMIRLNVCHNELFLPNL
jgi:hypothetical protein